MIAYCNFIPDAVWVREAENGLSHITLRRNFVEVEKISNMDGTTGTEKQYQFEERDICIPDRPNLADYVSANFDQLFMSNLSEYKQDKIQQLNDACNSTIYAGFKATNGHTYKFDQNYQANFTGGATMFNSDPAMVAIPFNTQDAGMIMHTKADFLQTCKDALNFKQEVLTKYFMLQGQVLAAQDYLSVDEINW